MNKFNEPKIYYCSFCDKQCHNLNSLKNHEIRCKQNPNKIHLTGHQWKAGERKNFKSPTKGKIVINNGIKHKYIFKEELNKYIELGWIKGMTNEAREKLKINNKGVASSHEKEILRRQKISNALKGNTNWKFNKRHGNSKQGWYKGIHCDSTWELAFLCYYIEHNLYIERCTIVRNYIYNDEKHLYFPDFITDEGIIEVKGRMDKKAIAKHEQNKDIIIYNSKKMKPILEYIINKYGNDFYKKLFEK